MREIDYKRVALASKTLLAVRCKLKPVRFQGITVKKLPSPTLLAFAALLSGAPAVHAEEGQLYGLLRSRDLSPFGFLRLDMRPAHAVNIETHTFAFEAELGYQNTWALSEHVEDYLTSLEPSGRRAIGSAE